MADITGTFDYDFLVGTASDDTLDGGWDFDTLDGGEGNDTTTDAFYPGEPIGWFVDDFYFDAPTGLEPLDDDWYFMGADELSVEWYAGDYLAVGQWFIENEYWGFPFLVSDQGYDYEFGDGIFTNLNVAALFARFDDTLVISFQVTNDDLFDSDPTLFFPDIQDQENWLHNLDYWTLFEPVVSALDDYIGDPANGIRTVSVTGHSLGASMVQPFLDVLDHEYGDLGGITFRGVTFATPGYPATVSFGDDRITNFWVDGDAIQTAAWLADHEGDDTDVAIDLYLHVVDRLQSVGLDLDDLQPLPENGINYSDVYLSVATQYQEGAADDDFDDYYAFSDPPGGSVVDGSDLFPSLLVGSQDTDDLNGGLGDDALFGGDGNDTLWGDLGHDIIYGGGGLDTAVFRGSIESYSIGPSESALIVDGPDGQDTLYGVEYLSFGSSAPVAVSSLSLAATSVALITLTRAGVSSYEVATPFSGTPIAGIQIDYEFLGAAVGEVAIGTESNDFFNLLAGDDAAAGGAGNDILDGGIGSNFLNGNEGTDTFFLDGRGGTVTWSTITDWSAGEQLSVWGWNANSRVVEWRDDGAAGFTGITMHADLNNDGTIDTSVTWTGQTQAGLPTPGQYAEQELLWFT